MPRLWAGKKVLLTCGPTREYIDPVRFFSNASSGKMGLALAARLRAEGAKVFLVCGPEVAVPKNWPHTSVVSAQEMLRACLKRFSKVDAFFSVAAVADFRPNHFYHRKIKKNAQGMNVYLVANPDILQTLAARKKRQLCIGFALESDHGLARAQKKLTQKNCDMIVLNAPKTLNSEKIQATLLLRDGHKIALPELSKKVCAQKILRAAAALFT